MSPCDSVRKNWLRSEKHKDHKSLLIKDHCEGWAERKPSNTAWLATKACWWIQQERPRDTWQNVVGWSWSTFRDFLGQKCVPWLFSWCSRYSCLNCWIFGHSCEDPRWPKDLKLAFAATPTGRGLKGAKWSKMCSLFTTVPFELLWWSGFRHAISCRTALIWRTCAVWKQQSTGPARNQPLWLESWNGSWRRGKDRIHWFPLIHWSITKHVYRKHHLLLLVR